MKKILSIQSHVVHGYVGNKASVYPLQCMGYDVLPINTVQFSNHTGYGKWKGEVFDAAHILDLFEGLIDIGAHEDCVAVLSGYMGSKEICEAVQEIVRRLKVMNKEVLYLCDPVIGDGRCYVKPEVCEFFINNLHADIITPNQYEAETISGIKITRLEDAKAIADLFHSKGIKIVVITGIKDLTDGLTVFASNFRNQYISETAQYDLPETVVGTGDLFSSIFLGSYLKNNNVEYALQNAVFYLQQVLLNTLKASEKELQVLSVKYDSKYKVFT